MTNIYVILACIALLENSDNGGDHGKSRGILHMQKAALVEANQISVSEISWEDLEDPEVAFEAGVLYCRYWARTCPKSIGHLWNAGPTGTSFDYSERLYNLVESVWESEKK